MKNDHRIEVLKEIIQKVLPHVFAEEKQADCAAIQDPEDKEDKEEIDPLQLKLDEGEDEEDSAPEMPQPKRQPNILQISLSEIVKPQAKQKEQSVVSELLGKKSRK